MTTDFPRESRHCSLCENCRTAQCEREDCGLRPVAPADLTAEQKYAMSYGQQMSAEVASAFVCGIELGREEASTPAAADDKPVFQITIEDGCWMTGGPTEAMHQLPDGEYGLYTRPAAASGEAVHLYRCIGRDERWTTSSQEEMEGLNPDWYEFKVLYTRPAPEVAGEAVQPDAAVVGGLSSGHVEAIHALGRDDPAVHAFLTLKRRDSLSWGDVLAQMVLHLARDKAALTAKLIKAAELRPAAGTAATPALLGLTQAQIDYIGEQWDECMYDAPGMTIDIGKAIRAELAKLSDPTSIIAALKEAP